MSPPKRKGRRTVITPDEGEHHHDHHGHHHHDQPSSSTTVDIELQESFLEHNRRLAKENRAFFDKHGIRAFNILGSVGAGKTSLIEAIVERLDHRRQEILVIAGDVTTTIDADRIGQHEVQTIQVNTGVE
ncbi:MAG: GTP-binding protein, partial [Promethearchaeota archaeon]